MSRLSGSTVLHATALATALAFGAPATQADELLWIDHLGFLAGDPSVSVSFNAVNSGVGGGLSGLIVESTTTGEEAEGGGNKVVQTAVSVPPGYLVEGVQVCYENSAASYISQIRLAQVQDPPATALVVLDDGTDLVDPGPVCVDSAPPFAETINPADGALLLSFRVNFIDIADRIVVRGVALHLTADPDSLLLNHTHEYLTGKGKGHNNTVATTTGPVAPEEEAEED